MALTPGLLLSDRYRLTNRIAIGGMGEVWAADDTRLARGVAVKILKSELTSDPEFVDRFRAEARITASLNHSGIAAVYDYGEVASTIGGPLDTAFLVMELVVGEPLSAVLTRTPRLSVPRTLDVLEQSGRALQVAHARALVHRDIKPGNILITPTGQVKITDFGIAKVAHQVPVTRGGMVMGTAQYLSPEQAAGQESLPPSDVYALGVVAYECLAGVRPFNGENAVAVAIAQVHDEPPPLPPDIPRPVAVLVMRMLVKDPSPQVPRRRIRGARRRDRPRRRRNGIRIAPDRFPHRSDAGPATQRRDRHHPVRCGCCPGCDPSGAGTWECRPRPGRIRTAVLRAAVAAGHPVRQASARLSGTGQPAHGRRCAHRRAGVARRRDRRCHPAHSHRHVGQSGWQRDRGRARRRRRQLFGHWCVVEVADRIGAPVRRPPSSAQVPVRTCGWA